ncbi:MAG: bifunctional methylenetetrahydrofolate dehydrogenase/methenyltetrahydrofolate cyclohydrolase FolD [Gammaproteobacteria bacterium]|nr:bifunctional methylenetetrahydrofolate dehydrogenase/methenyltetrahydrofolate cyclohydrolase FolD [Gammaproteobacteria bacterium]
MVAKVIDGRIIAQHVREECKGRVAALKARGIQPGLAVILVGSDPASKVYVAHKIKACTEVGLKSTAHEFAADAKPEVVEALIRQLNADPSIHGILVQLPLPPQFNMQRVLETISVDKDVDGFHLYNVGSLMTGNTVFPPCTPFGVMKMLEHEKIPIRGQNAVVVGQSNIVGKPMAMLLLQQGATVSICHSKTRDLAQYTIMADILVVAVGRPKMIIPQMVKKDAVVIDVGINRLPDGKLAGDVDYDGVKEKASYITPVPGGVGPMTVTMLVSNTIASAERGANAAAGAKAKQA